jgi:hypothetical protein
MDEGTEDLVGEVIGQLARDHGIAVARDDPLIATIFLNQAVGQRLLADAAAPALALMEEARQEGAAHLEQLARAQADWLEQVSLKDRAALLEEQKALLAGWRSEMEALIAGQNHALERIVQGTVRTLSAQVTTGRGGEGTSSPSVTRARSGRALPWLVLGLVVGALLNAGVVAAFLHLQG